MPKGFPQLSLDCGLEMLKLSEPILPVLNSNSSKLSQDDLKELLQSDLGKSKYTASFSLYGRTVEIS